MEFNFIPFIDSINHLCSKFSSLSSHPLFSTIVTLHTLTLLYAPSFFLRIVLSPVLNSTGIILLFLLKLGANERLERESCYLEHRVLDHIDKHCEQLTSNSCFVLESTSLEQRFLDMLDRNQTEPESHQMQVEFEHDLGLESNSHDANSIESSHVVERGETRMEMESESKQVYTKVKCLDWNMKTPLEIIYEAYEGEEEDDDDDSNGNEMDSSDKDVSGFEKYPSLPMYYLESETDNSSDDDLFMIMNSETHMSMFSKWDDYDWEELIENSVDCYEKRSIELCSFEEDNLIEIDIFSMTN